MLKKFKVHSLTGRIDMKLLLKAFKNVKRNRGAAGYDKVSIKVFENNLEQNLIALMKRLKKRGEYFSLPLRRVHIPKGKGKSRPLGIPTVRDRVAQEVIRLLIEPTFDPLFSDFSFGFRPNRNAHQAVQKILDFNKQGYKVVIDADIKGCFDNIPHELIIDLVAQEIADGNILLIIRRFLTANIAEKGKLYKCTKGTPQGGVISPLLANIVLNVLDKRLTQIPLDVVFVRYADDFVVLCRSNDDAEQALDYLSEVISNELELSLAQEKTCVTDFRKGFDFLGFHITSQGVTIRDKSVDKFKDKIRKITIRSYNFNGEIFSKVNRVSKGFANYFDTPFSTVKAQISKLDTWIRRRLRCLKFKRISKKDNLRFRNSTFQKIGLSAMAGYNNENKFPSIFGAIQRGSPSARKSHAGKYRELTLLRQRGGSD